MKDLVVLKENNAVTTSLMVAEVFGKRHDNVIRAIDQIKADSVEIPNALNFEEADFIDKNGENRRSYEMGRDAFMLLAMGFTGKEALKFKLMFIDAFNKMEAALASGGQLVPVRGYTRRQLAKPTFKPKGFNEVQRREIGGIVKAQGNHLLEAWSRKLDEAFGTGQRVPPLESGAETFIKDDLADWILDAGCMTIKNVRYMLAKMIDSADSAVESRPGDKRCRAFARALRFLDGGIMYCETVSRETQFVCDILETQIKKGDRDEKRFATNFHALKSLHRETLQAPFEARRY